MGIGTAVELPDQETQRRWDATSSNWPIMHLVMPGVTRDQFMARHRSNHIQVVYAPDEATAARAFAAKAAMFDALGVKVNVCGDLDALGVRLRGARAGRGVCARLARASGRQ